jgi:atypical dual specificity phosphatase
MPHGDTGAYHFGRTMLTTFYWIEDTLAGCSRPGGRGPDEAGQTVEDLAWLRQRRIGAVLSLTETPLDADVIARAGIEALHLPVPDMTAPLPEQFMRALDFIDEQRSMGRAVAVHCLVGQGRTATILAAHLIRGGMSADEAIAELRRACAGAIGSPEQESALHAFARRQDWIL